MKIRAIDTETTGLVRDSEPGVERPVLVEVGYTDIIWAPPAPTVVLEPQSMLVNAGRPIPPEASAVHHWRDRDIAGAPPPDQACAWLMKGAPDMFVAHNIDHERAFFSGGEVPWFCTYKTALRVYDTAPAHRLQVLRYWLKLEDDPVFDRDQAMPPHNAGPDSYVVAHLAARLLSVAKLEDMRRWSGGPALLITCWMKMHRGETWKHVAETDPSYLTFILDKSDINDRDIRATARYWLRKREEARGQTAAQNQHDRGTDAAAATGNQAAATGHGAAAAAAGRPAALGPIPSSGAGD